MFDKESKEYVNKHSEYNETFDMVLINSDTEKTFKDGAEFGYNKANEWHKQDIDDVYDLISKDWSVRYFICIMKDKSRLTAMGYCDEDLNGGTSVNLDFDHDDDKYYIDDVVWWKEIILPKEIE